MLRVLFKWEHEYTDKDNEPANKILNIYKF